MPNLKILEDKLAKLDGGLVLLQMLAKDSLAVNLEALKILRGLGYEGVYVSLSKSYAELAKALREQGIEAEGICFLDGVSQMYGLAQVISPEVSYVNSPLELTPLAEKIVKAVSVLSSEKKFVLFDSATVVLLYNALARSLVFCRSQSESLKRLNVLFIVEFVSLAQASNDLTRELEKMSSEVIDLQS